MSLNKKKTNKILKSEDSEKPYKLQHPDELFGYTRLMPQDTGLNQAIFLDEEGSYKRDGHQPLLFAMNGPWSEDMEFIPFSLSKQASILDKDIVLKITESDIQATQAFIRQNLDLLLGFADETIPYIKNFNAIKPYWNNLKIIFLDFDGVVSVLETRWELSDRHLERVKKICDETGAKIVISSSWRRKSVVETMKKIYGQDANVATCNSLLNINYVIGVTERLGPASRGREIKKWLDEHPGMERYVILDDDDFDMLPEQKPFLIQTDWAAGIEDEDVERAIEILSK